MRSRYSAYALGNADYLAATQRAPFDPTRLDEGLQWVGLTIHTPSGSEASPQARTGARSAGSEGHDPALPSTVEFTARYLAGDRLCSLRERSSFEQVNGRWIYTTGEPSLTEAKVERNQPCPCGSGRKFKSCHA